MTETAEDQELEAAQQRLLRQREALGLSTRSSADSNRDQPTTRIIECPRCRRRGAEIPNKIEQQHLEGFIWTPIYCPECFAFNAAETEQSEAKAAQAEKEQRRNAAQERLRSCGLPEPYVVGKRGSEDLEKGPSTESYKKAREACDKLLNGNLSAPWVYLCGDNGTYKSTLACVTLMYVLTAGREGSYKLWPDALDELRALNRDDAPEAVSHYVKRVAGIPHLLLDEVGFGTPTAFAAEKLFLILEKRYQLDSAAEPGQRWTIFTSNRTVAQLVQQFAPFDEFMMAPRLERRIAEMSTEIIIRSEDTDLTQENKP